MKSWLKILKSQAGLTMAEIVVAGGIMTAAGLGVASLMGQMGGSSKDAEAIIEKTQFLSAMILYANSGLGCNELKMAPVGANKAFGVDTPLRFSNWRWGGVKEFQAGTKLKYVTIKSLTATLNTDPSASTVKMTYPDGSTKDLKKTFLRLKTVVESKQRDYPHFYDLPVLVDSNNVLEFCGGSEKNMAETCTALNGEFDPATGACKFEESCSAYGSYVTLNCYPVENNSTCEAMNAAGGMNGQRPLIEGARNVPNPLTGFQNCPGDSTAVPTGADTWNLKVSCGKKCEAEVNFSQGYFTCLKCQ